MGTYVWYGIRNINQDNIASWLNKNVEPNNPCMT